VAVDWAAQAIDQLGWWWQAHVRPRLDGLSDDEYLWEPVPGCWSVRDGTLDWAYPEPVPPPLTTIAWRMGHVALGVFGARNASHFGAPAVDIRRYPGLAAEGVAVLEAAYATWMQGVAALGEDGMARPVGPAEGPWADSPMAALVLHINREAIHHLAEVLLLRDLYRRST
jgi:hypothetical protein